MANQENEKIESQVSDFLNDEAPEGFDTGPVVTEEDFYPPEEANEEVSEEEETVEEEVSETEETTETATKEEETTETTETTEVVETTEEVETTESSSSPELDALRQMVEKQNEMMEELRSQIAAGKTTETAETATESAAATEATTNLEFVTEDNIDDIVADPAKFNQMLNQVISAAYAVTHKALADAIPQAVTGSVSQQISMREYVKDFYKENQDLLAVKKTVGAIGNEVQAENPNWTIEQVFAETAKRTRESLGMTKPATSDKGGDKQENNQSKKPAQKSALPGGSKSRKGLSTTASTGIQKEINDIL